MVKAVADLSVSEQIDLKTLPEGWVKLRKMTYGQMLQRQDMAAKMVISGSSKQDAEMDIAMAQSVVTAFEFANSVADHNLEDENGNKLNFHNKADIERLDPQVGAEISELIDSMNQLPEDMQSGK